MNEGYTFHAITLPNYAVLRGLKFVDLVTVFDQWFINSV